MRLFLVGLLLASGFANACPALLDQHFRLLGQQQSQHLCEQYPNKLLLVVNTASKCAFTSQYEGLETLYSRYRDRGLVVLGFPSNDFAGQEPGSEAEIRDFCRLTYNVEFPMFAKTHVAKGQANPFFQQLARLSGDYPGWNFHKYLIAPDGTLLGSFSSVTAPLSDSLVNLIEQHLPE